MKAIFASKMYRSSKRKDKIRAAIDNPINTELVQQLREYLDDEYLTQEYFSQTDDVANEPISTEVDDEEAGGADNSISPSGGSSSGGGSGSALLDSLGDEQFDDAGQPVNPDESSTDGGEDSTEGVAESTATTGARVVGQTLLYPGTQISSDKLIEICEEIKGTLNMRQETTGVNRVLAKDNELWIYYDDKMNLNNVMSNVIELLNASCYYYLEFNRLARSDNAIVFQIELADTSSAVDPVGAIDGKKE